MQPLKLLLAVCLSLSFPLTAAHARDLVVFGEPTLMNALQRVGAAWRERSGLRVNVFVAPSDLSLAQIQRGARCDIVFALAGPATDDAERQGIIRFKAIAPILRNSLVLVARFGVAKPISSPDRAELATFLKGKRLAIANPDRDLAGTYGLRWLREIGLASEDDKNLIVAESAAGVATVLADNTAQLGIVYATDVATRPDLVVLMTLPGGNDPAIQYVAGEAMDPHSATKPFFDFLGSREAQVILQAAGLQVASE
ncbi:MAG: molybdate ABC transporter substrate-binding protein [Xanthobacteraceae bacterium]